MTTTASHHNPSTPTAFPTAVQGTSPISTTDGELEFRSLGPDDGELIAEALEGLSARSRQMRFASPMPRIDRRVLQYLCAIDGERHVAWGVVCGGRLVAMGRFVRLADDPATAEVSLTVTDGWQRRGLGPALLRQLAAAARELGIDRFAFTVSGDNRPAQKLLERLGVKLRYQSGLGEGFLAVAVIADAGVVRDMDRAA